MPSTAPGGVSPRLAYSIPEAAEALGITPRHLHNLIQRGEVRSVCLGRRRVVPRQVLDDILGIDASGGAS